MQVGRPVYGTRQARGFPHDPPIKEPCCGRKNTALVAVRPPYTFERPSQAPFFVVHMKDSLIVLIVST